MTPKKQKADDKSTTVATTAKPETPKIPAPTTPPQPTTATKQSQTVAKLKEAWMQKGINLDQLTEKPDGKFVLLQPTPAWPVIRIGPTGGIELPQIRSYAKAWDAALDGLAIFQKQQARDQKKATATSAPAAAKPQPAPAPAAKPETPATKKQKANAAIEAQLEARA